MSKIYCPSHKDVVLVRMHINPNQATKYGIPFSTKYWFCHELKKKRKVRNDKGISRR